MNANSHKSVDEIINEFHNNGKSWEHNIKETINFDDVDITIDEKHCRLYIKLYGGHIWIGGPTRKYYVNKEGKIKALVINHLPYISEETDFWLGVFGEPLLIACFLLILCLIIYALNS